MNPEKGNYNENEQLELNEVESTLPQQHMALFIKGNKGDLFGIHVNGNIALNDEIIGVSKDIADTFIESLLPQRVLNKWYNHTSNKEQTISDWERQREEDSNPFN